MRMSGGWRTSAPALVGRGVAGAHADGRVRAPVGPSRSAASAMPGERGPQVLLDVDGQRPQRREVEQAGAALAVVGRRGVGGAAGRSPTGTRRASCPSRWGPGSGCGRRRRWPASPWAWAGVGVGKVVENQARTGSENRSRAGSDATRSRYRAGATAGSPRSRSVPDVRALRRGRRGGRPRRLRPMAAPATREWHPAFEEYCETIFELHEDDVDVIQARIAERLDVSRPAVSEMIRRMEKADLVDRRRRPSSSPPTAPSWPSRWCAATVWPSGSSPTSSGLSWADAHVEAGDGSTSSPRPSRWP